MKKLVGIFLAALMLLSLGGCWTFAGTYFAADVAYKTYTGDDKKSPPADKEDWAGKAWVDKARVEPELQ